MICRSRRPATLRILATLAAVPALALAACGSDEAGEEQAAQPLPPQPPGAVGAFPTPDTISANAETELSFRGVSPGRVRGIEVDGERSGPSTGEIEPHADGQGASFVPDEPFAEGERVTVRTELDIAGSTDGDYAFRTSVRPPEGLGSESPPPDDLLSQYVAQNGEPPEGAVPIYRSRPDLRPPEIEIFKNDGNTAPGYVFLGPKKVFGATERPGLQEGAMIVDNEGEPVWFQPARYPADVRVQEFDGSPAISFWTGRSVLGSGEGVFQVFDQQYERVEQIAGGNGYQWDFHEGIITDRGTLISLVYNPVDYDLRPADGPQDGRIIDGIVQEVEIATGRVVFEWHSLESVKLSDANARSPASRDAPFDSFHVNAVGIDTDGNFLISGRDTWSVVKVNRTTGQEMWTLGGKSSNFTMPEEAQFGWQHDVQRASDGTIRIFDNAAAPKTRPQSRVLWLELDEENMTAEVARQVEHPEKLSSGTQANAQELPNGNTFVGWGSQGYFSEYTPDGKIIFDGRVARGTDSYRAYRMPWEGRPDSRPRVAVADNAAYVSWNGATEVATYELIGGPDRGSLEPIATSERTGFETRIALDNDPVVVRVRARDSDGELLGVSEVERVG